MKLRVTIDDQLYEVEVGDLHARPIQATVEGDTFEIWPEEAGSAQPAPAAAEPQPGAKKTATAVAPLDGPANKAQPSAAVLAPIPGVILSVTVKVGDSVSYGQELCVLEAMKMKNQIRANRSGVIAAICIAAGDQVKHGQVLMEYTN